MERTSENIIPFENQNKTEKKICSDIKEFIRTSNSSCLYATINKLKRLNRNFKVDLDNALLLNIGINQGDLEGKSHIILERKVDDGQVKYVYENGEESIFNKLFFKNKEDIISIDVNSELLFNPNNNPEEETQRKLNLYEMFRREIYPKITGKKELTSVDHVGIKMSFNKEDFTIREEGFIKTIIDVFLCACNKIFTNTNGELTQAIIKINRDNGWNDDMGIIGNNYIVQQRRVEALNPMDDIVDYIEVKKDNNMDNNGMKIELFYVHESND